MDSTGFHCFIFKYFFSFSGFHYYNVVARFLLTAPILTKCQPFKVFFFMQPNKSRSKESKKKKIKIKMKNIRGKKKNINHHIAKKKEKKRSEFFLRNLLRKTALKLRSIGSMGNLHFLWRRNFNCLELQIAFNMKGR